MGMVGVVQRSVPGDASVFCVRVCEPSADIGRAVRFTPRISLNTPKSNVAWASSLYPAERFVTRESQSSTGPRRLEMAPTDFD
jgi:hypothetical protein